MYLICITIAPILISDCVADFRRMVLNLDTVMVCLIFYFRQQLQWNICLGMIFLLQESYLQLYRLAFQSHR